MTRLHVAVLGEGPAGMTAAWRLAELGHDVTILERAARPGGLCMTVQRGAFRFDLGGHRFITRHPWLVERVRDLLGPDLLEAERRSVILTGGRRFAYPLEARNLARNLRPGEAARATAGFAAATVRRRLDPRPAVSFEDWVVDRFGRPLYRRFFEGYTRKLWGIEPSALSADWAAQRISLLNLADVGLRLVGARRGGARTYARRYLYPRWGIGQIFEAIADRLDTLGLDIRCGATATGLELRAGRVRQVRYTEAGVTRSMSCDAVIATIPLQVTAAMVEAAGAGSGVAEAAAQLTHRGLRFLDLTLDLPDLSTATWSYVPDEHVPFTRIQEPKRRSPWMAPPGQTSCMLEVPCDPGDRLWEADDATLAAELLPHMKALGFDVADRVMDVFSVRSADAYPVYGLGYAAPRDHLLSIVDAVPNLLTRGRQGLFRYLFMDTAMEMGAACAESLHSAAPLRGPEVMRIDRDPALHETRATTA